MRQYLYCVVLLFSLGHSYSQNPIPGNDLDFENQKVVMLGPPRDGFQRAIFDEVSPKEAKRLPVEDITYESNDIDAYDDKLVDLREEDPLFIPLAYRKVTVEQKTTKSTPFIGKGDGIIIRRPLPTIGQNASVGNIRQPSVQISLQTRPPFPSRNLLPQLQPSPPGSGAQQMALKRVTQRPDSIFQVLSFVSKPQPRPAFQPLQPSVWSAPSATLRTVQQPSSTTLRQSQQPFTSSLPPSTSSSIITRPLSLLQPPRIHLPAWVSSPPPLAERRTQLLQQSSRTSPETLRTGVCHASIFYISTPMQGSARHSFTHFAITVSTDQCARTCHEFNCAVAHYDPSTGHCQFNPSTAFAIPKGQCPLWPNHYKNNIKSNIPLRIFCVQCHRPIRRGRPRTRENRFKTTVLRSQFTGRTFNSQQSSRLAKAQSVLLVQPDIIIESIPDFDSKLVKQNQSIKRGNVVQYKTSHNDECLNDGDCELKKNERNANIEKQPNEKPTNEAVIRSTLNSKEIQRMNSKMTSTMSIED